MNTIIDSLKIYYQVAGTGMAVFFLHGWGGSTQSMQGLQSALTGYGYKVYVLDLPGFGKSDQPTAAWGLTDYSKFVLEFIRSTGEKKYLLFGHSFGGRIALALAADQPSGLEKLILSGVPFIRERSPKQLILFFGAKTLGMVFRLPLLSSVRPLIRYLAYKIAGERDYYQTAGVMSGTFKKVIGADLTGLAPRISVTTLVLWGEDDKITPIRSAYILERIITNSSLVTVKGVGHGLPLREPARVAGIIDNFVRKN